jgi:hypothetical protein
MLFTELHTLLQSSRGSYTSPALAKASYPIVDLPSMNDCEQSFMDSKFEYLHRDYLRKKQMVFFVG